MSVGRSIRPHCFRTCQSTIVSQQSRLLSTSRPLNDSQTPSPTTPATANLSPRWLSDTKKRIGKCITFGMTTQQTTEAGSILHEIARDWRELLAGSEGFLTSKDRRGLYRQEVVWGEMDSMGHVNNVTYNRYAESARILWAQRYARSIDPAHATQWTQLWTPKGDGLILRSIKTDFKFPMTFPDKVTVYHKLGGRPTKDTDSFVLDVLILSEVHQRPAARCVEDIVVYDYRKGKKTPLAPFMADAFKETWRLQEEAKRRNIWHLPRSYEKTLPERAPNSKRHLQGHLHQEFAIYSLVNFDAAQLQELEDAVNDDDLDTDTSPAKVADQPDFSGRTLRDVYDHHVLTRDECDWMNPLYFIVADQEDYTAKGLLVVNLYTQGDDDGADVDDTGIIGVARCNADSAGGWGVCFDLAEMLWSELKYEEYQKWGGINPDAKNEDGADGE
ncbi:hypothetical protein MBLNU457_g2741t1 [Dothideomycetes sp. NU457]